MTAYQRAQEQLQAAPARWLVTGAAGFIGSNLVERLLRLGQTVVGIDNFASGHAHNLADVREVVGSELWERFTFIEGDLRELAICREACAGIDLVLHQAALGSVPRSIADPIATNGSNVDGFLNVLVAARDAEVRRFIFATSSSVYGDHPALPKIEDRVGRPLSPYAASKLIDELYAFVFCRTYGTQTIGLRYFNVFGRRQDPDGAYAAVIPRWISNLLSGRSCVIYGDGETTRDFCYIDNVIQANLLAAVSAGSDVAGEVFNVAYGGRTTLNELYQYIADGLRRRDPRLHVPPPAYAEFRAADIRHSQADISKAREYLGYSPTHSAEQGLSETLEWYVQNLAAETAKNG
jgi:UDP-N-acetylglucosamine 4-epimerase